MKKIFIALLVLGFLSSYSFAAEEVNVTTGGNTAKASDKAEKKETKKAEQKEMKKAKRKKVKAEKKAKKAAKAAETKAAETKAVNQ